MKFVSIATTLILGIGNVVPVQAAQIVLSGSSVIGSTGSYGDRQATHIFDQQVGTVGDTGPQGIQYWINQENGPANAYISVDLGAAYTVGSFELYNAHNGQYGDRGTGDFSIVGANAITADGANGFTLAGPTTTLLSGTLDAVPITDPIAGQSFASSSNDTFRYLQFLPTSVASINTHCCSANEYGLAELRVFSATVVPGAPEPGSWAMMIVGFGAAGGALRRKRRLRASGFRASVA